MPKQKGECKSVKKGTYKTKQWLYASTRQAETCANVYKQVQHEKKNHVTSNDKRRLGTEEKPSFSFLQRAISMFCYLFATYLHMLRAF